MRPGINIVWTLVAAFLVFFMQAGFAMVETGFTRAKNSVNILMKNLFDFAIGSIVFFLVGFGLMFGKSNGLFGTTLFGLAGVAPGSGRPEAIGKHQPDPGDISMKLIIAYIPPHKLNDVKQALCKAEVYKMSVTNLLGCGQQKGYHESYRGRSNGGKPPQESQA
jgi:hypothetical protein